MCAGAGRRWHDGAAGGMSAAGLVDNNGQTGADDSRRATPRPGSRRGAVSLEEIVITGPSRLSGRVRVSGAKNAVLPALAASLLSDGPVRLREVPRLDDVQTMCAILEALGMDVTVVADRVDARPQGDLRAEAPEPLVRRMRASFLVLGPLVARLGRAVVPLPGGCAIGARPIDQHLKGLEALGARSVIEHGHVLVTAPRLRGDTVYLDYPSVGATENIMMAATLAEGQTVIENAAEEPEVVDLANLLNAMGARVRGAGTKVIRVDGVPSLRGMTHTVIPDRIEAGTFLIAAAITAGDVLVENAEPDHLKPVLAKLREAGVEVTAYPDGGVRARTRDPIVALDLKTLPFPGFPTDTQAPMMALLTIADGTSIVTETVFEDRYRHAEELRRLGAIVHVEGRSAVVKGVERLTGADVEATDLRGAAALVLAGLAAEGTTRVRGLQHLDRGYDRLENKLQALGARIRRDVDRRTPDEERPLLRVR